MSNDEKKRIDVLLVELGLVKSRTLSRKLIESGAVRLKNKIFKEANEKVAVTPDIKNEISISKSNLTQYVSRGGIKLEAALEKTKFSPADLAVLDVGISTGGFTDCLLQKGAKHIVGVDVGHGQLHDSLKNHPRLEAFEGINARNFQLDRTFDLAVIDVSFISLTQVLESTVRHVKSGGHILALVKPQFELNPKSLNPAGVVKDPAMYAEVEQKVREKSESLELKILSYFPCEITGGDGNQEFFIFLKKN
ncbi:MAG: TlyA family RNA methyltransferase [Bdellovibrionales bacterium]